ncbi:MAG: hypothetical protein PHU49_09705 [Syntrophorhabdaceae bacterium]|nr:hypothetical protein [Syntrophorhabdaceae bacterium]
MAEKRIKCLYGRQDCMFVKKGTCPREDQCLLAGELKAKMKQKEREEEGGEDLQDANTGEIHSESAYSAGVAVHH